MMKQLINFLFYFLFLFVINSCATYDKQVKIVSQSENDLSGTNIYLIGDAGKLDDKKPSKTLLALAEKTKLATENDILLFLGDNIYPKGFSENNSENDKDALDVPINIAKNFKGKVIFIPGNHDWFSGIEGLKKQEKYIEKALGKNTFLPQNACPIDQYEVSENIIIITVDSEWYLTNWDKHPKINEVCEIDSKEKFWGELKSIVNKNQNKTIVLAMHHPLESNGNHGGQFEFSILKSPLNVFRRASGTSLADSNFPLYREFSNRITTLLQEYKNNVIVVSGHEHNLQYLEYQDIPQIISGSGAKVKPVRHYKNQDQTFGYAGLGYSILAIKKDKQEALFYDENNTLIHTTLIRDNTIDSEINTSIFPQEKFKSASIYTNNEKPKSKLYNAFVGEHYRTYYYKDFTYPIVNLDTLYGGLKPVKLGGGNQSVSLRLEDEYGKEYVMRRMSKSATQFIQVNLFQEYYVRNSLKNTISENFVKDFYTTAYPFAPLVVSKLSENSGVYYSKPIILYVPKQNGLLSYNEKLGDNLYLFEERMSKESKGRVYFGNSDDIVSTDEVLENISHDEKYKINTDLYIRSRLFDMWLGDWDRHADQFRWATIKKSEDEIIYEPIPRDRDQAFSNFDGIFTQTITTLIPALRKFQTFGNDIKNVTAFNSNAISNDIIILNQTNLKQWIEQATELEKSLNNETIEQIFNDLPLGIQDNTSNEIKEKLLQRKKHLIKWATEYYKFLNENVIIKGTNKDDLFEINRLKDGRTEVKITRRKNELDANDRIFQKTFDPKITKEIWLYGLNDDDRFEVKGNNKSKIKVLLIGGQNTDTYAIDNSHNIKIYEYKLSECLFEGEKVSNKMTDDYDLNHYDYKKRKQNVRQILPYVAYNPDDGFILGGLAQFTKLGYELNPFTQKHSVGARYFSATNGFEISYTGEFARIFGKSNFKIETRYTTPAFAQNFFGLGNETENLEDELDIEYYRTRLEQFNFKPSIVRRGRLGSELELSIPFDYIKPNDNENRYVEQNLTNEELESKQFLGVETTYLFANKNNNSFPTLGIEFSILAGWKINVETSKQNFAYLSSAFQLDYPILKDDKLTLSSIWEVNLISNQNFEFYQSANIGGKNGLRGFRNERFSGQTSYYQNTDLRLNITDFNAGILPAKFGVFAGFDYGRVWLKNEDSNKWHTAFGGGLFVNASGLLTFQTSYFSSVEGGQFIFGLGLGF